MVVADSSSNLPSNDNPSVEFIIEKEECEICSLNSFIENKGIGTNLINKVKEYAKQKNCTRLKLITTNDNIRGLEFYQRRGFVFSKA